MNTNVRWLLLTPAVVAAIVASWLIYPIGISFALSNCPAEQHSQALWYIGPSAPSIPALDINDHTCTAGWFAAANRVLLATVILLSFFAAGFAGFRTAPSHKRQSAALACLFAMGAFACEWVLWS